MVPPAPTRGASRTSTTPVAPKKARASTAGQLTIQVGAYPSRAGADRIRKRLTARGFTARVVPAGRYFRVRVGRFTTRAAAAPTLKKLKAARYETIVVDAEPAP